MDPSLDKCVDLVASIAFGCPPINDPTHSFNESWNITGLVDDFSGAKLQCPVCSRGRPREHHYGHRLWFDSFQNGVAVNSGDVEIEDRKLRLESAI